MRFPQASSRYNPYPFGAEIAAVGLCETRNSFSDSGNGSLKKLLVRLAENMDGYPTSGVMLVIALPVRRSARLSISTTGPTDIVQCGAPTATSNWLFGILRASTRPAGRTTSFLYTWDG